MADNLLLLDALDEAVFAKKITPAAVKYLHSMYAPSAMVVDGEVCFTVEGETLPLKEAVDRAVEKNPAFHPPKTPAIDQAAVELEAVKADALTGNATAHSRLFKLIGKDGYNNWKVENAAAPGKEGRAKDKDTSNKSNGSDDRENNPWSAQGWNATKQGQLIRAIGLAKATEIAKSVGCVPGDVRPNAKFA
jgi:hypothetical protein